MHLFGDRVTLALGNLGDGDCGYTTVTTMRADPNATVDSSLCKRHKKFGESSYRGIPPKLRLEHFADAGERHQIDLENLNRDRGALGRALADPGFKFARRDRRSGL
jgi:hypothetical protein